MGKAAALAEHARAAFAALPGRGQAAVDLDVRERIGLHGHFVASSAARGQKPDARRDNDGADDCDTEKALPRVLRDSSTTTRSIRGFLGFDLAVELGVLGERGKLRPNLDRALVFAQRVAVMSFSTKVWLAICCSSSTALKRAVIHAFFDHDVAGAGVALERALSEASSLVASCGRGCGLASMTPML